MGISSHYHWQFNELNLFEDRLDESTNSRLMWAAKNALTGRCDCHGHHFRSGMPIRISTDQTAMALRMHHTRHVLLNRLRLTQRRSPAPRRILFSRNRHETIAIPMFTVTPILAVSIAVVCGDWTRDGGNQSAGFNTTVLIATSHAKITLREVDAIGPLGFRFGNSKRLGSTPGRSRPTGDVDEAIAATLETRAAGAIGIAARILGILGGGRNFSGRGRGDGGGRVCDGEQWIPELG